MYMHTYTHTHIHTYIHVHIGWKDITGGVHCLFHGGAGRYPRGQGWRVSGQVHQVGRRHESARFRARYCQRRLHHSTDSATSVRVICSASSWINPPPPQTSLCFNKPLPPPVLLRPRPASVSFIAFALNTPPSSTLPHRLGGGPRWTQVRALGPRVGKCTLGERVLGTKFILGN